MKAEYPEVLDDFRLTQSREDYNAGVTEDRPLSPLRYAHILRELETLLGDEAGTVAGSVTGRMKTAEAEIDAITADLGALEGAAVTTAGTNLSKVGNTMSLIASPVVTTIVLPNGVVLQESGGRLFLQKNVLVQGADGFNAANEEAFMYFGDTNNFIKAKYGVGIIIGVPSVATALQIDQNTGDATVFGFMKALGGYKSGDGSEGITDGLSYTDGDAKTHTVTIKNGIITGWTIT